ncbi:MltA domain-containing protein [Haliea sp. E1-2-M8]|uniref:MltA domain-containing protein n=1 Tax=Haliea sp. E1-2-M8 TaxID=3064706 RepID=UPI002715D025|nr:MltA domain-containing protein [Haliea sp. E1-2-M8]MDO8863335.1 MltA domain-containing protein [Haliea sp. E1-2-M8]
MSARLTSLYRLASIAALLLAGGNACASPAFSPATTLPAGQWAGHSAELCEVAAATADYLARGRAYDPAAIHGGTSALLQTSPQRIRETLEFVCAVQQQDQARGQPSRLSDPAFIQQHFELLRWHPDRARAATLAAGKPLLQRLPEDRLLLTKYYVRVADGSAQQSAATPHALYGLPFDEAELPLAEADAQRDSITRYRYGKQRVVALETSPESANKMAALAPPLIWLSRADLEGALLQGTAVVEDERGQRRYFNVHRNNGVAYDRSRKPEAQERYWYFKEVPGVLGYGKDADYKIPVRPLVTVAGDIFQLGLGRLVLLRAEEAGQPTFRLTVLADTGGAFHDNLYQLDWLSGYYRGWDDYHAANRQISDYAEAWLLLKRQ